MTAEVLLHNIKKLKAFKILFDLIEGITYQPGTAVINSQMGSGDFLLSKFDLTDLLFKLKDLSMEIGKFQVMNNLIFTKQ